ncbi:MAG: hypothetical protein BGO95_03895 [Micrococcales bacterium 73-13]|nr:MAG: hypothetical protein BGO95_03895 [Micrococcales bacterium 73-13]
MSDQQQPGTPAEGPDPFDELLKGLADDAPATSDAAPTAAAPASSADVPTVAMPATAGAPAAELPTPEPAGVPAELPPTVVLPGTAQPTAATTVLADGGGGGLPPEQPPTGGGFRDWDPRRKALVITLIAVAGVLIIALIILLVVLFSAKGEPGPSPTTSPTHSTGPTPTPTPTRSATPTPAPTTVKPAVQSFTANSSTAVCPDTGAGTNVTMHFAWTVVGATQIAIASGPVAIDAIANPFQNNLPATATDFQMPFGCANSQLTYTLTIAGPDGQHYSGVLTVTRQYTPPPPTNPTIGTWSPSTTTIACPADPSDPVPPLTLSWNVTNWQSGNYLVFGISNPGEYTQFTNSSGSITSPDDFPAFPCGDGQQTYYLTLFKADGQQLDQKVVTVTEQ